MSSFFPSETRPRRHPDSAFKPIGDEGGLVVLPDRREVKVLNPVGVRIFGLLDGVRTIDEIVREICNEYEVSAEDAGRDVRAFIEELSLHGMLAGPDSSAQEVPS